MAPVAIRDKRIIMTRKHFEAIAKIINKHNNKHNSELKSLYGLARNLSDYLATTNEHFKRDRFMQSCGFNPEKP